MIKQLKLEISKTLLLLALATFLTHVSQVQAGISTDSLFNNFQNPSEAAKPRTWWHWTGGNITPDGITKDLEWMKRVGIAGFQLADVSFGGSQTVDKKLLFGTNEWLAAVHHAAKEADRLDLEMAVFSSAGWSLTGGPWVKPEQAMKKLVWSDTLVHGPGKLLFKLPHPPINNGPIRNLKLGNRPNQEPDPTYYKDVVVIAYPVSKSVVDMMQLKPRVTSNVDLLNANALLDDDINSMVILTSPENSDPVWIQYEFDTPFSARAFTISGSKGVPVGRLLASEDGESYHTIVTLPGTQLYRQGWVRTFAFPETKAKFYRLEITAAPLGPAETMLQNKYEAADEYVLSEAVLHTQPYVHRWEEKAGFRHLFEYESVPTPDILSETAIQKEDIVDLTSKMNDDGYLEWNAPAGNWKILRFGYSLTGVKNRPAMKSGLGFEVDKLSAEHTEAYIRDYFELLSDALSPHYSKTLEYVLLDSWEAGTQNWTENILTEFEQRRGYNAAPYLPALAGHVVENAEVSDRFLWDFRRTLADMFAENHYGVISRFLQKQGIGTYGEASGVSLEIPEDALLCKKFMDIPMGEFWVRALHPELMYYQDIRGAASAAHIYGKNIVAAEAFTGGNYETPFTLKKIADYWFCQGVNRLVFHTSAHQPLDSKPGNTMVGTHLHRNITWAEQAKPFMDYVARTSMMLQQGHFVADVAYLLNEGAPSTMPIWGDGLSPELPEGYDYDYINTDILLNSLSVSDNGQLILKNGMNYKILVLPTIDRMTLPVLQKIQDLVLRGATIVGVKPVASPSLKDYPAVDEKIRAIANSLWGDLDGVSRVKLKVAKGTVIWGLPLSSVLDQMDIKKDVEYSKALDMDLYWIHLQTETEDIYFVVNSSEQAQDIDIRFRVQGKIPELWHPDSGKRSPVSFKTADNLTTVSLSLVQHGSVFIVFSEQAQQESKYLPDEKRTIIKTLTGPWKINFPANSGTPDEIVIEDLQSWAENKDPGIKFFSGTANYFKNFQIKDEWFTDGARLMLDLGRVGDIAEVSLNKNTLGILWKPPYTIDITDHLKIGENQLNIKVTNQWTNRMLGDRDPKANKKILASGSENIRFFFGAPSLQESGLIGPVSLQKIQRMR